MMLFAIILVLLDCFGPIELSNTQIAHYQNITLRSCGLRSFSSEPPKINHCFKWHKTIIEMQTVLKNIKDGRDAKSGEFPFAVFITAIKNNEASRCSGVILNENWIITAAHCLFDYSANHFRVYTGNTYYTTHTKYMAVSKIFKHELYDESDPEYKFYDIALLKLTNKINVNRETSNGVCLPTFRFNIEPNELATFSGWGAIDDRNHNRKILKLTQIKLNQFYLRKFVFILSNDVPFGKPCTGDSGGPLVQYVNGRAVLIGILRSTAPYRSGILCGPVNEMLFTPIPMHVNWILHTIRNNNL